VRGGSSRSFGKALLYLPLVDTQRSEFTTLTDGRPLLRKAAYRTTFDLDFSIARDQEFCERLVVSQKFVDLCRREALRVDFAEPI
jgi:hypothetical protein